MPYAEAVVSPEAEPPEVELTIVMPCLNEAETLAKCIQKARAFLESNGVFEEIIVGDNGSVDGSQEIARQSGARVVNVSVPGYGAAVYYGTLAARGSYVIMGDADDSYDFSDLMPFLEQLRGGCELVMGNRFAGGIKAGAMPWKNRYIGNPLLSGVGRLFFRCPVRDFHCGMRGYSLEAFRQLDLRTTGMEFASEMVIKATLRRMRIAEVPTTLSPDGRSRPPHLRAWRDGWRHLRFMLLFSPRWLFLYPGLFFVLLGTVGGMLLWRGPLHLGRVVLDVHTLVFCAACILVGFQAMVFALLTKVFAINEGLLPEDPTLNRLFRFLTLETGLAAGLALGGIGLAGTLWSLHIWSVHSYGPLDPQQMLRAVIPSATSLVLGCQTVLFSFFFSVLGLSMRRANQP